MSRYSISNNVPLLFIYHKLFLILFHQIISFKTTTMFFFLVFDRLCLLANDHMCVCVCIVCYIYTIFFVQLLKLSFFSHTASISLKHIFIPLFDCFTSIFSLCYLCMRIAFFTANNKSSVFFFLFLRM
jgi:hypothetical protein